MYRDFYKLADEPFRITPDPDFLFLTEQYKEALAAIVYGIAQRKGFVCITGEVGVGKTTILRSYLDRVDQSGLRFVYVLNPAVAFNDLLATILADLGLAVEAGCDDAPALVGRLHQYLIDAYREGKTVVLFIDEAHNMPVETMESLRMLSNLETATDKLLQIVLVGQPELEELLARRQLRQLKSRIAVSARLKPLSKTDSLAYIRHRLDRVVLDDRPVFTAAALGLIAKRARGIPRNINVLCDNALITGFGHRRRPVTWSIVREVVRDRDGPRKSWLRRPLTAVLAGVLALGLGFATSWETAVKAKTNVAAHVGAAHPAKARPVQDIGPAAEESPDGADLAVLPTPVVRSSRRSGGDATPAVLHGWQVGDVSAIALPMPARTVTYSAAAYDPSTMMEMFDPVVRAGRAARPESADAATAPAFDASAAPPVSRVVRPGDTLGRLTQTIYGMADATRLTWVQGHNPDIADIHRLRVGQVIMFPPFPSGGLGD